MKELDPKAQLVLGVEDVARRYNHGRWWARTLLREWWDEQQDGGPVRVFRRPWKRGKGGYAYFTTVGALAMYMPPARDEALVRKVTELERAADHLARQVEGLITKVAALEWRDRERRKMGR